MSENSTGAYLRNIVPKGISHKDFFTSYVMDAKAEIILKKSAREDARRYAYNAVVSFLSGIAGLNEQQAGWSITKLYYTAFYVGRAALCRARYVVFHVADITSSKHTQYEIRIAAGERAQVVTKNPSTHKLVAKRFQQYCYPSFMRGLSIDGIDPILWLLNKREYWQYRSSRFPDPDFPSILDKFDIKKVQRILAEYANDTKGIYLADPDHAIISVPFRLVDWVLAEDSLMSPGIVDVDDIKHLRKKCSIGKQTLSLISKYLNI